MGQVSRKFEVIEGGVPIVGENSIGNPIENLLGADEFWLSAKELSQLANIKIQPARRAIKSGKWRGAELVVREVEIGRGGAVGKALQVLVQSLPDDLRVRWYASHGIELHEKVGGPAIHVKAESAFGGGLLGEASRIEELCDTGANELFTLPGLDLGTYGNTFLRAIRSRDGARILGLRRLPAVTMSAPAQGLPPAGAEGRWRHPATR